MTMCFKRDLHMNSDLSITYIQHDHMTFKTHPLRSRPLASIPSNTSPLPASHGNQLYPHNIILTLVSFQERKLYIHHHHQQHHHRHHHHHNHHHQHMRRHNIPNENNFSNAVFPIFCPPDPLSSHTHTHTHTNLTKC